ncbi:MAG: VTT domain-containing protein [Chloroflexi bacterium]|nr:VTT domain-containing protein [Chloroflexota bacterium]
MDIEHLIITTGYVGLFAIIFAESGLFFGFFLPGDSLLLTTGLLALKGYFDLWLLLPILFIAAVLGDNVGYWFGAKMGPRLFNREDKPTFEGQGRIKWLANKLFRRKNLLAAKAFYEKHGGKTITLARFLPFIRTFAPIVAGAAEMQYSRFVFFNLFGGLFWAVGVTMAGYLLGTLIPPEKLDQYFLIIVLAAFIIPGLPTLLHLWKEEKDAIIAFVRRLVLNKETPEGATTAPSFGDAEK